ncbi:SixA phosphatase family protein [Magnetospirillum gryphiswaldense]|uniref:Phosphohistidine phosphatase n=2 Tax=Magnetospirillum gryphiswaldense TaxID=55518 RepID=V6EZX1_MAGGM|nr:histidine phosphatase family protein [Magnetospirillum gryphiswaldense]AVM74309.1 2,3-bisphosphoglycerate-dependent phosphoglycerate mutase [Magnetospirillum gryphiswaldense MSR-1]AVM78212.1 2,3-bisphosphoglycerate-dependent phosphoglycerate mutase [Magnetospirillum gryphiswaldense]CAM76033.1 Phosphoglycerate mutase family protein [Magnetospirillum gryphiswaldense MSR-1]CDK97611.1 Putative phosphohistidine phosphatase [Magnetospirillum gryphiswaldense MSR-1 v2]
MKRIYLLRHAKSSWDEAGLDDFQRPLNPRGRKAAKAMGKYLKQHGIRPNLILCSAAARTRATYDILEPRLEGVPVSFEDRLYEATRGDLLHRLQALDGHLHSVLLIGHNPGLEKLALGLSAGNGDAEAVKRLEQKYPTGTLAVLETNVPHWPELDAGTCRLLDFIRPRDLDADDED